MRILLTFAGARDPFNPDELIEGQKTEGPILTLLREQAFDFVYIFTDERLLGNARELARELGARRPSAKTKIIELNLVDPTDYEAIFYHVNSHCRSLLKKHAGDNSSYFISTASGTPQMQTVWFLLAQSGLIPATLLKVTPLRFLRQGEQAVSEIKLSLAEFPKISPAEVDSLELASLRVQREKWEAERESLFKDIEAEGIIGKSKAIQNALKTLFKAAPTDLPIVILGETGTGKELFAKAALKWSLRSNKPFVTVNCAAIPKDLVESELFGHKKGVFTGAFFEKRGMFEVVNGGTLFLDEVGDLPLTTQPKLLRALREGEIAKVGSTERIRVNVRVIAATNKPLRKMIADGSFREDLYHRLNGIPIQLPPVRERPEDIPLLIEHFLRQIPGNKKKVSKKALKILMDYGWPGNVGELENVIKRMAALSEGDVMTEQDIPSEIVLGTNQLDEPSREVVIPPSGIELDKYLFELEKAYVQKAVEMKDGNQAAAARLLRVEPHTFRKRAKEKFGL